MQVVKSPLTHKLVAFIFIAILLIEVIILLPSYLRKEKDLLDILVRSAEQVVQTSFYALSNPDDFLIYSLAILQSPVVEGVRISDKQGKIIVESGERVVSAENQLQNKNSFRTKDKNRYEFRVPSKLTPISHVIYLRLDSSKISVQLKNYVFRIASLIVLVTIVLTIATLIGAGFVVLRPLLALRDALGESGDFDWEVQRGQELKRKDEIGEVYRATVQLLGKLNESQRNLEARVEERTSMLEDSRKESEEKERVLRSIFETAAVGIVIHAADGKTRTMVNDAFCRMVGYSKEHLLNASYDDLTHPDDLQQSLENRKKLANGDIDNFTIIKRYIHKDGHIVWGNISSTVLRDEQGNVDNYVSFIRDTTQQKEAEKELEKKTSMLEATLENMDQGITMVDKDLQYTSYNKKFIEMFDFPEVMFQPGISIKDVQKFCVKRGDYDAEVAEKRLAEVKKFKSHVFERRTKDGKVYELRSNVVEGGGLVTTYTDITERKQTEEILRKGKEDAEALAKAKSDFVAVVSHEIRTPMNGVLGMARLLSDTKLTSEQKESVNVIVESGNALLKIIDDLLDISKLDAEKLELEYAPFAPADVITQAVALMSSRTQEKDLILSHTIDPTVPDVLIGDAHRLRQVLLNLVGNAVKFTEQGSINVDVTIAMKSESNVTLAFAIKDTGIGISEDDQNKLFSDYAQGSVDVARKHGGTGLGLSVCKRITERMGGDISVESKLGEGSTFKFSAVFAIGSANDIAENANVELEKVQDNGKKLEFRPLRILQVEDNETNRDVAERILTRVGHQVTNAINGQEGLAAAKTGQYDIILMDRHMPIMDGIKATQKIRALSEPLASIPILGITAGATQLELQECLDAGMNHVLKKPVYSKELCESVLRLTSDEPEETISTYNLPVLVVDDTNINRVVAKSQLGKLGASCDLANSGAEAISMFKQKQYGLVLTDITMPNMDGIELASAINKLNGNGRQCPLIAMTGHLDKDEHKKYLQSGFADVLTKPVALEKLSNILNKWLGDSPNNEDSDIKAETAKDIPPIDLEELIRIYGEDDENELFEIIGMFVDQFPPLLTTLESAVEEKDTQAIRDAAHAAKGASASAAATQMRELLFTLEKEAFSENWEFIIQHTSDVRAEFSRVIEFKQSH